MTQRYTLTNTRPAAIRAMLEDNRKLARENLLISIGAGIVLAGLVTLFLI